MRDFTKIGGHVRVLTLTRPILGRFPSHPGLNIILRIYELKEAIGEALMPGMTRLQHEREALKDWVKGSQSEFQ